MVCLTVGRLGCFPYQDVAADRGYGETWIDPGDMTSATLVRRPGLAVDRVEGLAEVVGDGVGGSDGVGPAWMAMVR